MTPLLVTLEALDVQIALVDAKLETLCAEEPVVTRLTTTPGVGLLVAAAFVSVIDDAKRFRDAHQVASSLGLVPCEDSSGGRTRHRLGAISKQGNSYLRSLLVQGAWTLLRTGQSEDPLRTWARTVIERRGKRIAIVALARRLSAVLWAMWRDGTVYDAARVGAAIARGLDRRAQSTEVQADALRRAASKARERERERTKVLGSAASARQAQPRRSATA